MGNSVVGLDIGSKYVKYVEIVNRQLVSIGLTPAPPKGINSESPLDHDALVVTIKKLFKDGGVKVPAVNVALPESKVFTRIIQVPRLSERELMSAIKWESEQYIPLPLTDVQMDFSIIGESVDQDIKKLDVLLVAAPRTVIDRYVTILDKCDLDIEAMETEIISASRALMPPKFDKPLSVMIVNLGASTTDLSIIKNNTIVFTRSVPFGGDSLTRVLAEDLGLPLAQAEEFKKTYGLDQTKLEGKIFRALQPIFGEVVEEIKRSFKYFTNKYSEETLSSIVLSGGTAKLPGLVEKIVEDIGIETQIGNPWQQLNRDLQKFAKIEEQASIFCVATGLALRTD